jgi:predicted hydrolase (HD superfamily)
MNRMTLEQAQALLDQHLHTEALKKHCLASAAIMRTLAERFSENADEWEIIGLLHDIDFDLTRDLKTMAGIEARLMG